MGSNFKRYGGLVLLLSLKLNESSIRKKLLLWLLVPLISLCTLSTFVAYLLAEKFANESYDMLLVESADSIAARLGRNEEGILVADLPIAAQAILRHNGKDHFFYQIADNYGRRLTGDSVLPLPRDLNEKGPKFRYASVAGKEVRICRIAVRINPSPDEIWVQVAETLNSRQWLLQQIFLSIIAPQLVLIALASLSVWLGVKHGLDPLERLGHLLRTRGKLDLSPVNIGNTPVELAPVTKSLNKLFLNVSNQIDSQRQFIGNAAHQLRTPVTALKTYVDYAERIKDPGALEPVLKQMSEATRRVAHLLNRLLSLAHSEEPGKRVLEQIDLLTIIDEAAENVIHLALSRGVEMDFNLPQSAISIRGDRGDLVEMLTNLLDNAITYAPENGAVWVKIENSESACLTIEDNGPGIPDLEKAKIFERFYRIPGTTGAGCGLGLSIVEEIANSNNIRIEVLDRAEGGAKFRLTFS